MEMIKISDKLKDVQFDIAPKVMELYNPNIRMKTEASEGSDIEIFSDIDKWYYGLEYLDWKLREAENKDVNILINSGGGSLFEGVAMYNRLKMHKAKVTTKVIGIAASSASIIAMAGDEIEIAPTATIMIHNGSVPIYANKEQMRETADLLEQFDDNIANLYSTVTGITVDEIKAMMTNETFIIGDKAIELGFATALIDETKIKDVENQPEISAHKVDLIMAKAGISRKERRELLKDIKNFNATQNADVDNNTPSAVNKYNVELF